MVRIKNPLTVIIAGEEGTASTDVKITKYSSGKITGENLGDGGYVYLLDRNTHSYTTVAVNNWTSTEITLANEIDLSSIEGTTCLFVKTSDNKNSNKLMIHGSKLVNGYGVIYLQEDEANPTSIRKVYFTTTNDLAGLCGVNNYWYYSRTTSAGNTYDMKDVVGFQFGNDITSYTPSANFLGNMLKFNQPVYIPSGVTLTGSYFMRYDYSFDCPIEFDSSIRRVGNYFMYYCYSFNQPLDLSNFNLLSNTYFLYYCRSFNSEITFPSTCSNSTQIGAYFMNYCYGFNQVLELPTNIKTFGSYFLRNCSGFNQPLELPSGLTGVGTYFLSTCYSFNKPLTIPSTLTSVATYFLQNCYAFNSPITFKTTSNMTLGNYFMAGCIAFNQPVDFISKVTTFGTYFMQGNYAFNQPIEFSSSLKTLGAYFMNTCFSFSRPIDLKNITTVGTYFLYYTPNMRQVNVQSATSPTDNFTLSVSTIKNSSAYATGITLYGTNRASWISSLPDETGTTNYRKLVDGGE